VRRLGKNPWKSGVRTTATVERVHVTDQRESELNGFPSQGTDHSVVHLTFRFRDEHGAEVIQPRRCLITLNYIPAPGSRVEIAYLPGKPDKLEYDERSIRPPGRDVPRGWSAGTFAVDDLGEPPKGMLDRLEGAMSMLDRLSAKPSTPQEGGLGGRLAGAVIGDPMAGEVGDDPTEIDAQRDLFRAGTPIVATITSVRDTRRRRGRNIFEQALVLQTAEGTVQTTAFVAGSAISGDEIKIVINPDGSRVALDTDERFTSARTAQGLVFSRPRDV
jgi:hypothetical protein